jgi:hypothetical protein
MYYSEIGGFPWRSKETRFRILVPGDQGVMTRIRGDGFKDLSPGALIATMKTENAQDIDTKPGEIQVEVQVDHVTPEGAGPDCVLEATDAETGTTAVARFRAVAQ